MKIHTSASLPVATLINSMPFLGIRGVMVFLGLCTVNNQINIQTVAFFKLQFKSDSPPKSLSS